MVTELDKVFSGRQPREMTNKLHFRDQLHLHHQGNVIQLCTQPLLPIYPHRSLVRSRRQANGS